MRCEPLVVTGYPKLKTDLPSTFPSQNLQHVGDRQDIEVLREAVRPGAWVNDVQAVQAERVSRDLQGFGHGRGVRVFHFDADALPVAKEKQVEFGAGLRSPEVRFAFTRMAEDFLDGKALPRCAKFRIGLRRG